MGTHMERSITKCIPFAMVTIVVIFLLLQTPRIHLAIGRRWSNQITESCFYETQWPNYCEAMRANWASPNCDLLKSKANLLLVIPFRNRETQLKEFKIYMDEYLTKAVDVADWRFLIAEQLPHQNDSFNRGAVSNAGVWEFFEHRLKRDSSFLPDWMCIHDVDGMPQSP